MDISKILVPVDFSEHSQRALDEAIGLAKTFGAQLHLLHCYQIHPAALAPYGIVVPEAFEHDIRMAALQRLAEWREKVAAQGVRAICGRVGLAGHAQPNRKIDASVGILENSSLMV